MTGNESRQVSRPEITQSQRGWRAGFHSKCMESRWRSLSRKGHKQYTEMYILKIPLVGI